MGRFVPASRDQRIAYIETFLSQFLTAALLAYSARRLGAWTQNRIIALFGAALFCAFCPIQYEVFIWNFGVQVVSCYFLITLALIAIAFYSRAQGKSVWLITALVAGWAAPYTLAGGQIVWPFLLVAAWSLRLRTRDILLITASGALSIILYFIGYVNPVNHSNPLESLRHLDEVTRYVLLYFGTSFDIFGRPLAYGLTSISIIAVLVLNARIIIRRNAAPFDVAVLSLAAVLFGNAFVTALGRIKFGTEQAATSRYQTSALLFWLCNFILLLSWASRRGQRFERSVYGAALLVMLFAGFHLPGPWSHARDWHQDTRFATAALTVSVKDDSVFGAVADPSVVFRDVDFMRAHSMATYDSPEYRRMGAHIDSVFEITPPEHCRGYLDGVTPLADPLWPGFHAAGWAWDETAQLPVDHIVITNEDGRITGLALGGLQRADVPAALPSVRSAFTGWIGYISGELKWREAHAYAILTDGRKACPIPNIVKL